jgi:hypothetical protein
MLCGIILAAIVVGFIGEAIALFLGFGGRGVGAVVAVVWIVLSLVVNFAISRQRG